VALQYGALTGAVDASTGLTDPHAKAQEYVYVANRLPSVKKGGPPQRHGLLSIEYWFFYPFNYLPVLAVGPALSVAPDLASILTADYHQGDWEHIDVLVDKASRKPRFVYMAQHDKGHTYDWSATDHQKADLQFDAGHPKVYVAFGGHASYPTCGHRTLFDVRFCPATATAAAQKDPNVLIFPAGRTRLVGLDPHSWACWRGLFGYVPPPTKLARLARLALPSNVAHFFNHLLRIQAGPAAPLLQESGACTPAPFRAGPPGSA
jgi:hypothetical protein